MVQADRTFSLDCHFIRDTSCFPFFRYKYLSWYKNSKVMKNNESFLRILQPNFLLDLRQSNDQSLCFIQNKCHSPCFEPVKKSGQYFLLFEINTEFKMENYSSNTLYISRHKNKNSSWKEANYSVSSSKSTGFVQKLVVSLTFNIGPKEASLRLQKLSSTIFFNSLMRLRKVIKIKK